ncbi:GrpB family protein [Paenibacillus qinlingensis]|uniref:GrpB family protein n=1 Tax=Paenibacillus qinlingensis TaxID=1837343 RepID=UPI0015660F28|nr:GrpB family protein [Paenibacillus qinlingensis]
MVQEVVIEAYNSAWIEEFESEKKKISQVLANNVHQIEHIGSTSIVGMPAKPILDIAVSVNSLDEADLFIEPLKTLGYEYVPKLDFPNRRFFRKGARKKGTHHLHVYEQSSDEWSHNLLFRNYLRSHPEQAAAYAELKKHLASLYVEDRATYTQMKAPFIQSIIDLAKKE